MTTGSMPESIYNGGWGGGWGNAPIYSITGSYKIGENPFLTSYIPPMMAEALKEKDGEVKQYFEKLGYRVSWDMNTRAHEKWWEIFDKKTDELIIQIDMGVPLADIIEDICCFAKGKKEGTSKSDYKFSGEPGPRMNAFYKKVYRYNNLQSRRK
jgi:hypothetical protein